MKGVRFAFLLLVLAGMRATAKDHIAGVLPAEYGEVIFVRRESEGSLNILPAIITCDMWERAVLTGGEAGSIYLTTGEYEFQAYSREPYEPDSEPTTCRSAAKRVSVKKGKKVFLEVIPVPAEGKTRFYWMLKVL